MPASRLILILIAIPILSFTGCAVILRDSAWLWLSAFSMLLIPNCMIIWGLCLIVRESSSTVLGFAKCIVILPFAVPLIWIEWTFLTFFFDK